MTRWGWLPADSVKQIKRPTSNGESAVLLVCAASGINVSSRVFIERKALLNSWLQLKTWIFAVLFTQPGVVVVLIAVLFPWRKIIFDVTRWAPIIHLKPLGKFSMHFGLFQNYVQVIVNFHLVQCWYRFQGIQGLPTNNGLFIKVQNNCATGNKNKYV